MSDLEKYRAKNAKVAIKSGETLQSMAHKEKIMSPRARSIKEKMLPAVLLVGLVIAVGMAVFFYMELNKTKQDPQEAASKEALQIIEKVSRLIVLPEGETPTIATVSDPEKLQDQPFFSKAQQGDRVLIYTNAKKAILYNPATNKIVEVAPLNIGDTQEP
jgi:hypothetical protein